MAEAGAVCSGSVVEARGWGQWFPQPSPRSSSPSVSFWDPHPQARPPSTCRWGGSSLCSSLPPAKANGTPAPSLLPVLPSL